MAVSDSVDPAGWFAEQIGACEPDLLRKMVKTMAETLMSAEADAICGAEYGQRSGERVNRRNGYRERDWDTRAGTIELAIPKLRSGSYFPEWLLERRRRAEQALVSVIATSYLLGVSTRRVDKLVDPLGIKGISKSQVSEMSKVLDAQVEAFRSRALDAGPYSFVWLDALTQKVREGGRTVNVHVLVATGVNADGHREILGVEVTSAENGAGWLSFLRGLVARGLSGVQLVISDAHRGLVEAIAATLPGAAWQRCRTH
jgi:transposase-like protein